MHLHLHRIAKFVCLSCLNVLLGHDLRIRARAQSTHRQLSQVLSVNDLSAAGIPFLKPPKPNEVSDKYGLTHMPPQPLRNGLKVPKPQNNDASLGIGTSLKATLARLLPACMLRNKRSLQVLSHSVVHSQA